MTDPVAKALEWSGVRALQPVWDELARRMGASDRPVRRVKVVGLDDAGRRALASLFGNPRVPTEAELRIDTGKLAQAFGLDYAGLRSLVEELCGPIENRAAARDAESKARRGLWEAAEARLGTRIPRTLVKLRAAGVPGGDVEAHAQVLERLAVVLERLPLSESLPLPMLAWKIYGDPHALDVVDAVGKYLGVAATELAGPDAAESTRRALATFGVVGDRLSTTTVTFGVRAQPNTPAGAMLETAASVSMPVNISGAMLDAGTPRFTQRRWLCVENPSIVEACTLEGIDIPLVCTSGWLSHDTQLLLRLAVQQEIELVYAGDYDEEGLEIARWMAELFGATIAMSAAVYLGADHGRAPPWPGRIPRTPWDEALARAIEERRRVVYQEDPSVWRGLVQGFSC